MTFLSLPICYVASCKTETAIGKKTKKNFTWPVTPMEQAAKVSCSEADRNIAKRDCYKESEDIAYWGEVDDTNCELPQEQRAQQLNNLAMVSDTTFYTLF